MDGGKEGRRDPNACILICSGSAEVFAMSVDIFVFYLGFFVGVILFFSGSHLLQVL